MLTSRDITRHQILVFRGSAAFAAENLHASVISRKASPPTYGKQNAANSYQTNVLLPFVVRVCVVVFFFLFFFLCVRVCVFLGVGECWFPSAMRTRQQQTSTNTSLVANLPQITYSISLEQKLKF